MLRRMPIPELHFHGGHGHSLLRDASWKCFYNVVVVWSKEHVHDCIDALEKVRFPKPPKPRAWQIEVRKTYT